MPLEKIENISEEITLALWRLDESVVELKTLLRLNEQEKTVFSGFVNESRKKQWLAYRLLLRGLLNDYDLVIEYDSNRKPHLVHYPYHISVTHSCHYAGVIIGRKNRVGIDLEKVSPRIEKIKSRFLNEKELEYLKSDYKLEELYVYWCAKESLYKLHGRKKLDFRDNIMLEKINSNKEGSFQGRIFLNQKELNYQLHFRKFHDYILVYVAET